MDIQSLAACIKENSMNLIAGSLEIGETSISFKVMEMHQFDIKVWIAGGRIIESVDTPDNLYSYDTLADYAEFLRNEPEVS